MQKIRLVIIFNGFSSIDEFGFDICFLLFLEQQLKSLTSEKDVCLKQIEELLKEKEQLESKFSVTDGDFTALQVRLQEHENKYKELREISEDQMTELENREKDIINLKGEIHELVSDDDNIGIFWIVSRFFYL